MSGTRTHRARGVLAPSGPVLLTLAAALVLPFAVAGCEDQVTSSSQANTTEDGAAPPASQPVVPAPPPVNATEDPYPPMEHPLMLSLSFFPKNWFFYPPTDPSNMDRPPLSEALDGEMAPPLVVKQWYGEPQDLARLKGKIVVIQFWGTHRRAPMKTLERNKALVEKYGDQGVVFIGIHDGLEGTEDIPAAIETFGLNYPVGVDDGDASVKNYAVTLWPNYIVIDHWGYVRAAGLLTNRVPEVVETLIQQRTDAVEAAKAAKAVGLGG